MAMAKSLMHMFEMHLDAEAVQVDQIKKYIKTWIQGVFMFSLIWSIGASVDLEGRDKFSDLILEMQTGKSEEYPPPVSG